MTTVDIVGTGFWWLMFITPLVTTPIFWRRKELPKAGRIARGVIAAAMLSFVLYHLSLALLFRDGMGP